MEIDQLIAALAPSDVLGWAPVEIADLAYDARVPGTQKKRLPGPAARAS